jgi:hypothetical protein
LDPSGPWSRRFGKGRDEIERAVRRLVVSARTLWRIPAEEELPPLKLGGRVVVSIEPIKA